MINNQMFKHMMEIMEGLHKSSDKDEVAKFRGMASVFLKTWDIEIRIQKGIIQGLPMDEEVRVISEITKILNDCKVCKEFDLPRVMDYIQDRFDWSSKNGRKSMVEKIDFLLNRFDKNKFPREEQV